MRSENIERRTQTAIAGCSGKAAKEVLEYHVTADQQDALSGR